MTRKALRQKALDFAKGKQIDDEDVGSMLHAQQWGGASFRVEWADEHQNWVYTGDSDNIWLDNSRITFGVTGGCYCLSYPKALFYERRGQLYSREPQLENENEDKA